jgi:hypothetical protein
VHTLALDVTYVTDIEQKAKPAFSFPGTEGLRWSYTSEFHKRGMACSAFAF